MEVHILLDTVDTEELLRFKITVSTSSRMVSQRLASTRTLLFGRHWANCVTSFPGFRQARPLFQWRHVSSGSWTEFKARSLPVSLLDLLGGAA